MKLYNYIGLILAIISTVQNSGTDAKTDCQTCGDLVSSILKVSVHL